MAHKLLRYMILASAAIIAGCSQPDYAIVTSGNGETVYEEIIVEIDVPIYIEVEVPGETEYGEIWVDSFTQPQSVDGVDILWIIDTSGSMNRYDPELMAGIEAMMNALPESGWRLAMLSSDPGHASVEAQFPLVPGDTAADAIDMYNRMGRGHEENGFDAAYEYIVNNVYAQTWMRPDAALLVVFVSDEEEQSNTHLNNVSDFTSWYSSLRFGSSYISSIVNVEAADSVCLSPPSSINIGFRYIEATNYFAGVVVDICEADWSSGVADASTRIEPYEKIELTYLVSNEATIRVFVDGVLNWDWHYQSSDNTVYFDVLPAANEHVEVAYHYDPDDPYGFGTNDTGDTGA
tara:strand:+ start:1863 stop:2906 length:1044 start_codon:yes stop_codon:yes gene_type:complete